MQSLNINRKTTDSFYRYKMPRLIAKIEGRGNGIKTVIANLVDISKALNRPPMYPLKFIGCELGAQTGTDLKNDRYIINGAHDSEKLQSILFLFIDKFVLCQKCHNPETILTVYAKKEKISIKCSACGHQSVLQNSTRVTSYIIKNPPKIITDSYSKSSKTRQIDNEFNMSNKSNSNLKSPTSQNGVIAGKDMTNGFNNSDENLLEENAEKFGNGKTTLVSSNDLDQPTKDVPNGITFKSVPTVDNKELTDRLKLLCLESDASKPFKERISIFEKFFMERYRKNENMMLYIHDVIAEIKRLEISTKAIIAVCECIFTDNIFEQLKINSVPLAMITYENSKAQAYMLECIEKIISENQDVLLKQVPSIFKILFDMNVIEEEVFLKWELKKSFRWIDTEIHEKICASATQFLEWIKQEEESSSEEEDESSDLEASKVSPNSTENIDNKISESTSHQPISWDARVGPYNSNNLVPTNNDDDSDDSINLDDI